MRVPVITWSRVQSTSISISNAYGPDGQKKGKKKDSEKCTCVPYRVTNSMRSRCVNESTHGEIGKNVLNEMNKLRNTNDCV